MSTGPKPTAPVVRFWRKVRKTETCWLWTGAQRSEYGQFHPRKGKSIKAHRYAYELTYGAVPAGKLVCHTCDNPLCVNPAHLWLGTDKDNMQDAARKGRIPHAKFTPAQVRAIRRRVAEGEVQSHLARELDVSRSAINQIVLRQTYAHVR